MLAGRPKTVAELCERIFPTVRPMDRYLAYSEVLGFLMYLEDLGHVERRTGRLRERWVVVPAGAPNKDRIPLRYGLAPDVARDDGAPSATPSATR